MQFQRTANAGGLLEIDGVRILLDGVNSACRNYEATPGALLERLLAEPPDMIAYTHIHPDHFSPAYTAHYARKAELPIILGGGDLAECMPEIPWIQDTAAIGMVRIAPLSSRHIGKSGQFPHRSYVLSGSANVWFLGDAAPAQWRSSDVSPAPRFLIAPFAYALTEAAWKTVAWFSPEVFILLHLPESAQDTERIRSAVQTVINRHPEQRVVIPKMGEIVTE